MFCAYLEVRSSTGKCLVQGLSGFCVRRVRAGFGVVCTVMAVSMMCFAISCTLQLYQLYEVHGTLLCFGTFAKRIGYMASNGCKNVAWDLWGGLARIVLTCGSSML